jgi:N-acetyl-gamma-glutamyl-phosphate reductase
MAVIPLLSAGLIDESSIIVDAKSGASGAGKKMTENLLFSELHGDFYPYKVLQHQHVPEMEMYLDYFNQSQPKKRTKVVFTPHLLPVFRGILSTCYLKWSESLKDLSVDQKNARIKTAYASAYESYPLVDWGSLKDMQKKISLKAIAGSCMTHIGYEADNDNLIVFSALDNLLKGAASQAVENLNSIYGFPQQESLG